MLTNTEIIYFFEYVVQHQLTLPALYEWLLSSAVELPYLKYRGMLENQVIGQVRD
jgi:hypothetical protein